MAPAPRYKFRPDSGDATLATIMANLESSNRAHIVDRAQAAQDRAEIKAELAATHNDIKKELTEIRAGQDKIAERVVVLEKDTWMRSGRAAAAVFVIGFLSWFVPWFFAGGKK